MAWRSAGFVGTEIGTSTDSEFSVDKRTFNREFKIEAGTLARDGGRENHSPDLRAVKGA
jgi:hypothetical protein